MMNQWKRLWRYPPRQASAPLQPKKPRATRFPFDGYHVLISDDCGDGRQTLPITAAGQGRGDLEPDPSDFTGPSEPNACYIGRDT